MNGVHGIVGSLGAPSFPIHRFFHSMFARLLDALFLSMGQWRGLKKRLVSLSLAFSFLDQTRLDIGGSFLTDILTAVPAALSARDGMCSRDEHFLLH
jgi:hypothetical protein